MLFKLNLFYVPDRTIEINPRVRAFHVFKAMSAKASGNKTATLNFRPNKNGNKTFLRNPRPI